MPLKLCLCILSFFICIGAVIADPRAKSAPEAQQPDFGKDFAMLFQMGLPRLKGAQLVLVTIYKSPVPTYDYKIPTSAIVHELTLVGEPSISWMKFPDNNTEPAACILGGVFECKLYNRWAITPSEEANPNSFAGEWQIITPAQIAEDINKIFQLKNNENDENNNYDEYGVRSDKSTYGLLLLQAAQLYESGAKQEANKIATRLFEANGSEKVMQAALNVLAGAQYLRAYCDLTESKDWVKFNADLKRIIGKFKNYWENVRYAKAIQAAVAKRIKNPEPPELKTSIPLSEDKQNLIVQLSKINQEDLAGLNGCWLFDNNNKAQDDADKTRKKPDVITRIESGGIKYIPLLIAMLDDEWMLPFRNTDRYSYNTLNAETEQDCNLADAAGHLPTPMTRGELARRLLKPLIIPAKGNDDEKNGAFKVRCQSWYDGIKNLNIKELQKKYFSDGSESQKAVALRSMIAGVDDTTAAAVESALIEYNSDLKAKNLLYMYCKTRPDKISQLVEKLRAGCYQHLNQKFKEQTQEYKSSKEKLDRYLDWLDPAKSVAPLEDVVKEMQATTTAKALMSVSSKFTRSAMGQPMAKIYQVCLDAAIQSKNIKKKRLFLDLPEMLQDGKSPNRQDIMKFKTQFEKLLADQSISNWPFGGNQDFALIVAEKIEAIYTGKNNDQYYLWDKKYKQFMLRRAQAIIDGIQDDKLPKLMDIKELKNSQISEAKARISGKNNNEIRAFCKQSQLEELLPLSAALQQDKKLNSKLLPLANLIIEIDTDNPEIKVQIAKFKGQELTEQVLQEILKIAENYMMNVQNQILDVSIVRSSSLQGVIIKFDSTILDPDFNINHADRLLVGFSLNNFSGGMSRNVILKNRQHSKTVDPELTARNDFFNPDVSEKSQKIQEQKFMKDFNKAFLKDGNALWAGKILISCGE
ncbi:MAG: hypothetical protein ACYC4Q_05425 [Victivallaceae bacterium]